MDVRKIKTSLTGPFDKNGQAKLISAAYLLVMKRSCHADNGADLYASSYLKRLECVGLNKPTRLRQQLSCEF